MKENVAEYIQNVFNETVKSYKIILEQYFPSLKKKRFTERNQTFLFAHNYLKDNNESIIWQELPIQFENKNEEGNKKTKSAGHIDTFIIDDKNKSLIFIEAKCLSKGEIRIKDRLEAIQKDLVRLDDIVTGKINAAKYPKLSVEAEKYTKYILILADIWNPGEGSESSKVLSCWDRNKNIIWGKDLSRSFRIRCSCEEIAVGKEVIHEYEGNMIEKKYSYNLLFRLYKSK